MKSKYVIFAMIVFYCCLTGCSKETGQQAEKKGGAKTSDDMLLVKSETIKIYVDDVKANIIAGVKATHGQEAPASIEELTDKILGEKVNMFYVFEDAKKNGFLESDRAQLVRKFQSGVAKQQKIEQKMREDILASITDEEIAAGLPRKYEKIMLRQIIVPTLSEAQEVLKKAKAGEDFIELVRKYSIGPSSFSRDGLTDLFLPGTDYFMEQKDEDIAFTLSEGDVYDGVVKTSLGYMVYKIQQKEILDDAAKEMLRQKSIASIANLRAAKAMDEITQKYKDRVKILESELFDAIKADMADEVVDDIVIAKFDDISLTYYDLDLIQTEISNRETFLKNNILLNYLLYKNRIGKILRVMVMDDHFSGDVFV